MLDEQDLAKRVKKLMFRNMIHGYSKALDFEYGYTQPSPERYPFQYFWDTCFHAIIMMALGETEHSRLHLKSLFAMQRDDGFIGNIIYWKKVMPARITDFFQMKASETIRFRSPHMSNILHPPVIAQTVKVIYERSGDKEFVREVLPGLKKYYNWLATNRDFDNDKLLSIISPFESGMDWKATFDPVVNFSGKANWKLFVKIAGVDFKNFIRNYNLEKIASSGYFNVKDVGFNSIYARNLQELADLCEACGDNEGDSYRKLAKEVTNSIVNIMYNEKDAAFYDVYGADNNHIKILTPTIFYPVIMDHVPDEVDGNVMKRHFNKSDEFDVPYPIPSLAQNEKAFYPKASIYIWRGPTWILNNWYMHKYFIRKQHFEQADALLKSMLRLIEKSGFREYYDPFTGEGYGARDFTWGGLVLDMLHNSRESRNNNNN